MNDLHALLRLALGTILAMYIMHLVFCKKWLLPVHENSNEEIQKIAVPWSSFKPLTPRRLPPSAKHDLQTVMLKTDPFFNHTQNRMLNNLPDAILIGSKNSGTGALLDFLSMNPYINAPPRFKWELNFFNNDLAYRRGLKIYNDLLPARIPRAVTIEKTQAYFAYPNAAPRIYAMNDSIKLLLILRDPVKRIISDYWHENMCVNISSGPYIQLENTLLLEELVFTSAGDLNIAYRAVLASMYDLHLERWFRYFPPEQILILDGQEFRDDPLPILRKCETFLGLPNIINETMLIFDEERGLYCRKDMECLPEIGRKHKPFPKNLVDKLYRLYTPHVKRTFDLIQQRFNWMGYGYDQEINGKVFAGT